MQGKLFQKCTHLLYCNVLSLGANVNTRRMSQPDMGSIFHIKKSMKYSSNYYVNYQNYQNLMLLTSLDTKQTLMHLFLFTNSAQREMFSICAQSIRDSNKLSLHYNLEISHVVIVNNWKYNVKLLKKSILQNFYCKGVFIFLYTIIYLLY